MRWLGLVCPAAIMSRVYLEAERLETTSDYGKDMWQGFSCAKLRAEQESEEAEIQ